MTEYIKASVTTLVSLATFSRVRSIVISFLIRFLFRHNDIVVACPSCYISWFSFLTVLLFVLFECPWRRSCTYLSATVFLVSIPAPKVKHVQIVALNDVCTAHVSPTMSVIFHFNSSSYYSKYGKLSSRLRTFICLMDISVLIPRQ